MALQPEQGFPRRSVRRDVEKFKQEPIQAADDFVRFRRDAIKVNTRCLRVW